MVTHFAYDRYLISYIALSLIFPVTQQSTSFSLANKAIIPFSPPLDSNYFHLTNVLYLITATNPSYPRLHPSDTQLPYLITPPTPLPLLPFPLGQPTPRSSLPFSGGVSATPICFPDGWIKWLIQIRVSLAN